MEEKQQGNSIEVEAGSLEEAIQKALEVLCVKRQEVSIKVQRREKRAFRYGRRHPHKNKSDD